MRIGGAGNAKRGNVREGGGRGNGTAVGRVVVPEGAEAAPAGARGEGRISVARETGSAVQLPGGGGSGHGTAVACVVVFGGAETAGAGP